MSSSLTYNLIHLPRGLKQFGDVLIPGSKSSTLRVLLLSAELSKETRIVNILKSDDTVVMIKALEQLGASIIFLDSTTLSISGPLIHSSAEKRLI